MSRRDDPDGVGAQLERLSTLAGTKGNPLDKAVTVRDLRGRVLKILEDRERAARQDGTPNGPRVADFNADLGRTPLSPGFYNWALGSSRNVPLEGAGGAALLMKRGEEVAAWLAAATSGFTGDNELALFAKVTSGKPSDWGRWREIYHEGNVVAGSGYDGRAFTDLKKAESAQPTGPQWAFQQNAAGTVFRSGSGLQLCYRTDMTLQFDGNVANVAGAWSFPKPFQNAPFVAAVMPSGGANFTGYAASDFATFGITPGLTEAAIILRRRDGAPDLGTGDKVENVACFAIGAWWDE